MKLTKKFTDLGLAVAMLASIGATSVFASGVSSNNFNTSGQEVSALENQTESDCITSEFSEMARSVNTAIQDPFSGNGSTSWQSSFSTSYSQPCYQVTVSNTGTSDVTVYVRKTNGNGDVQTSFVVPAGKTITSDTMKTNNLWNIPGTRYVVINSNNGNAFKGDIVVKIASDSFELEDD